MSGVDPSKDGESYDDLVSRVYELEHSLAEVVSSLRETNIIVGAQNEALIELFHMTRIIDRGDFDALCKMKLEQMRAYIAQQVEEVESDQ